MRERTESTALSINNVLPTKLDPSSLRFESNMRALADLVAQVRNEEEKIREGGGPKAIESQHAKSRLTGRERIDLLADPGSFFELGLYAAHKMYEDWGGAPSAGVFLPLQEDVFPDTDDFGRVFRNNAVMSAMGIPQIAAIMGMCVAGGGYLPVMCDHVLMTDGSGLFLAGPA